MKLYLVHCGFYDLGICDGMYESHVNLFVVAGSFQEARMNVKQKAEFKQRRMHIDGLQELTSVDGYQIQVSQDLSLEGSSVISTERHRELAPAPAKTI